MNEQIITVLYARRYEGIEISETAEVRIKHDKGLNLLEAMDKCFSAWYNTEEGSKAWEYTCEDLNIGDALSGMRPSNEFTRQFGFEFLPDDFDNVIEIDYDRVFGRPETDIDDDRDEERTLAVEQLCERCVRTFPSLQPFFKTGSAEWLKID